ncbi:hypothetical protein QZH41_019690 [Actinostola sp. cb2023]|nr:hypothetical protein QZH41_019690 [Actinostola sp. cb2023]
MRQCRTINPGAVIYSAPEALSIHQTPKIDVFSFGLLLCEMVIRELPVPTHSQQQVAMVANQLLKDLISKCIQEDHEKRPTMEEILHHLEPLFFK